MPTNAVEPGRHISAGRRRRGPVNLAVRAWVQSSSRLEQRPLSRQKYQICAGAGPRELDPAAAPNGGYLRSGIGLTKSLTVIWPQAGPVWRGARLPGGSRRGRPARLAWCRVRCRSLGPVGWEISANLGRDVRAGARARGWRWEITWGAEVGRLIRSGFPTTCGTRSRPTAVPSCSRSLARTSHPASSGAALPAARICRPAKPVSDLAGRDHAGPGAGSKEAISTAAGGWAELNFMGIAGPDSLGSA
jgi:hypothetical protein